VFRQRAILILHIVTTVFCSIIDTATPTRELEHISSSDSSDSEEESLPLALFLRQEDSFITPGNFSDLSDVEAEDLTNVGRLLSKTIDSVDNVTTVSHYNCLSCILGL